MVVYDVIKEVNKVLNAISSAINAERTTFFIINQEQNILESIVAQGVTDIILKIPLFKGIIGECVKSEISIIENDPQSSIYFDATYDRILNYRTESIICIPVKDAEGSVIGGLQSLNSTKGKFDQYNLKVLSSFVPIVSLLAHYSKSYFESKNLNKAYCSLLESYGIITSELDLECLVPLIMRKAAEITFSERATLYFVNPKNGILTSKFAEGLEGEEIQVKGGVAGLTFKTKTAKIVNEPYKNEEFDNFIDLQTGFKTDSILCVPIMHKNGEVFGVIQVINHIEGNFTPQEQLVLEGFATQIQIALDNSILFNQIDGIKNYLKVLIENMDNGIITMDNDGFIQTYNKKFAQMFELHEGTRFQSGINLVKVDGEMQQILKQCLYPIKTGKKYQEFDLSFSLGRKRKIIFNMTALPMENSAGDFVGVIGLFQDVTKEKRIASNLSRYIPHHLVNEILNKENLSILQSKNRRCSVLFSDVRNFTALTESLGANEVVKLLNAYFDIMVEAIHENHGVLDKFIGDAVMGVFGIPYTNNNDPIYAIDCALKMVEKLEKLNKSKLFKVNLNIGIGISTGDVISGNIGSIKRYEYTVIGDSVNLASRLEGETKNFKEQILICKATQKIAKKLFICKEIGDIPIKGKLELEKVYAVIGRKCNVPQELALSSSNSSKT